MSNWSSVIGASSFSSTLYEVCNPSGAPIVGAVYFKNPSPCRTIGLDQTRYKSIPLHPYYKNDDEGWTTIHYVKRAKKSMIRD